MKQKHISPIKRQAAYAALAASALLAPARILSAGPRGSANYTIATDTTDAGGTRATSTSYTHDGSAGLIAGLATVASPAETIVSDNGNERTVADPDASESKKFYRVQVTHT
jgi:hypothetical protein